MKLEEILAKTAERKELRTFRAKAASEAAVRGFPSSRDEHWRYADFSALSGRYLEAEAGAQVGPLARVGEGSRLVFVDGFFRPELSDPLPSGVSFSPIVRLDDGCLLPAKGPESYFALVNAARFPEGAFLEIFGNPTPLQLLHVSTSGLLYPRLLVKLKKNACAHIVEEHSGAEEGAYCAMPVAEYFLEENASLHHMRFIKEGGSAVHLGSADICLEKGSFYSLQQLSLSGRMSRLDLAVHLLGEGAECRLDGLSLSSGKENVSVHSAVYHTTARAKSAQLQKCIASGAAHAAFSGKIWVGVGASGTDSSQQSRNLLLSPRARIDAQPQLEIYNDDVKCSHGATVGRLDPEELFYLQSRGLDEKAAYSLLTYAFAAEIVDRIPLPALAAALGKTLYDRMGELTA